MVYTLTLETASLMVKVGLAQNHDNFLFNVYREKLEKLLSTD